MARRSPQNDYICLRCGCPCTPDGARHLGGGQGIRSCGRPPRPILRAELDRQAVEIVETVLGRHRVKREKSGS